ncbi:MAG: hypothetical protein MI864_18445 [Pseudomonadales bacterium]|nr:hypothetical protein [Pseudomonadales bacterium]
MMYWIGLGFLGIVFIAAIIFSSIAYKRQQALYLKRSQIRQHKRTLEELNELQNTLLRVDPEMELVQLIQLKVVQIHQKITQIDPGATVYADELKNQSERLKQYQEKKKNPDANYALNNDNDIEITNLHLNGIFKMLVKAKKSGNLPEGRFKHFAGHLQNLKLNIEVSSHRHQAERYLAENDRVMAQTHLKLAREALRSTKLDFPEKAEQIRELTTNIKQVMAGYIGEQNKPKSNDTTAPSKSTPTQEKVAETEGLKKKF